MASRSRRMVELAVLLMGVAASARAHSGSLEHTYPALVDYFSLGVEHILLGFDHLVFLLGVVLIASRTRTVLAAVTAFTVAHSLTLGLSVLGVASVSARLVEPLIALSVAYVGLENFWLRDGRGRYRLTFAFGLVHGFGFAGALSEIGVPPDRAPAALALFNLGVEAGQLLVLALVWPLLIWLRRSPRLPLVQLARAVNVALVLLGAGWAVERTIGSEPAVAVAASVAPPAPVAVPASPLAERICRAVQRLPRERRAACAGGAVGVTFEAECTRMLSASVARGSLRIDEGAAAACTSALESRYSACEFTRVAVLPPIAACEAAGQGQLAAGAACQSSLECASGLHCHGVGADRPGVCGAPKPVGASCGGSIDALAVYLPDRAADHPECSGRCGGGRCVP